MKRSNLSKLSNAKFSVIKQRGDLNSAVLEDGTRVTREEFLYFPEIASDPSKPWEAIVACAPYDNHFIFANPVHKKGFVSFQCTCGAVAVVVGAKEYRGKMSATHSGMLFVCHNHQTFGKHADGSS